MAQRMRVHAALTAAVLLVAGLFIGAPAAFAQPTGCQPPGATGAYPPSAASILVSPTVVAAGGTVVVTVSGFASTGNADFVLCSDPVSLGSTPLAANGTARARVTIPRSTTPGQHILQASGPNGQGGETVVSTTLTVTSLTNGAPVTGTTGGGGLAFTGTEIAGMSLVGILLFAGGAVLVIATRRRRGQSTI